MRQMAGASPILRPALKNQIMEMLDSSIFSSHDFAVTYQSDCLFSITFNYQKNYIFSVNHSINVENVVVYSVDVVPGQFHEKESFRCDSLELCIPEIKNWVNYIETEMKASSAIHKAFEQEFEKFRQELVQRFQENLQKHLDDPEPHFNREEAENLRKNLDEFKQQFEQFESITKEEIEKLKNSIEGLKMTIDLLSKQDWLKSAVNKIASMYKWVRKSEQVKAIAQDITEDTIKTLTSGNG